MLGDAAGGGVATVAVGGLPRSEPRSISGEAMFALPEFLPRVALSARLPRPGTGGELSLEDGCGGDCWPSWVVDGVTFVAPLENPCRPP